MSASAITITVASRCKATCARSSNDPDSSYSVFYDKALASNA